MRTAVAGDEPERRHYDHASAIEGLLASGLFVSGPGSDPAIVRRRDRAGRWRHSRLSHEFTTSCHMHKD